MRRRYWLLPLLILSLPLTSCTVDDGVFTNLGTLRVLFVDSGIQEQSVVDPTRIQAVRWIPTVAALTLDGQSRDMLVGNDPPCVYTDTSSPFFLPNVEGKCATGLIVEADPVEDSIRLTVATTMRAFRAEPVDLPPGGDFDGDGLANASDNCALVPNPDQEDDNLDGAGNRCSVVNRLGGIELDSDGDGVADSLDNCVAVANPLQEFPSAGSMRVILDGSIGGRCREQVAEVQLNGAAEFELPPPPPAAPLEVADYTQTSFTNSILTVDFNGSLMSCNWDAPTPVCTINPAEVDVCIHTSLSAASGGC